MKKLISLAVLSLGLAMNVAHAADDAKKPTAQQTKMGECNKDAGDKKGDERKAFMKSCLSAKKAEASAAKKTAQQEKMAACNKDAGDKKGDERKKFMSTCLKK